MSLAFPFAQRLASFLVWAAFAIAAVPLASAQPDTGLPGEVDVRGTSYFVYTEPGAPTVQVIMVGEGIRTGIYRLETGTTLVQALALAGGTAQSDSTDRVVRTATVSVLRDEGNVRQTIYQAQAERLYLEPQRHPDLQTGDVITVAVNYETVRQKFTLRDGIEIASRVASLVSVILLLTRRF